MLGSLSKKPFPRLTALDHKKKQTVYPKVASCDQQKVVIATGQQTPAFLGTAQAAEEFQHLAELTPSSHTDTSFICDVQLFTPPCSEQFFLSTSTDRACGNSIHCMGPAVQFHYANDNADN